MAIIGGPFVMLISVGCACGEAAKWWRAGQHGVACHAALADVAEILNNKNESNIN
jgi:hypothetical protein